MDIGVNQTKGHIGMMSDLHFANKIRIIWEVGLDGGGSTQYLDFLDYLLSTGKKYNSGLEWCSGLGAIGFSILDADICENMVFMDSYGPAEEYTLYNAKENNISDRVKFFGVDMIQKLPKDIKFDLVMGNPPHCESIPKEITDVNVHAERLVLDRNWDIHREFFQNIPNYLNPGADIILSEIWVNPELIKMAEDSGLIYLGYSPAKQLAKNSNPMALLMHFTI